MPWMEALMRSEPWYILISHLYEHKYGLHSNGPIIRLFFVPDLFEVSSKIRGDFDACIRPEQTPQMKTLRAIHKFILIYI